MPPPPRTIVASACEGSTKSDSLLHAGFAGSRVLLEIRWRAIGCGEACAASLDERALLPATRRVFGPASLQDQQRLWLA